MSLLKELSERRLDLEFDRIAQLRDDCEKSLAEIRAEKARRKDAKVQMIRAKLASKGGAA